jgi:hypothetical protein
MGDTAMIAKLVTGTIDPARLDVAARAVEEELIPGFLTHDGALQGYWMVDAATGQILAITTWRDPEAVGRSAVADGTERAVIADRIGLRVHAINTLPVLAAHDPDPVPHGSVIRWVRVTWVEGVAPHLRPGLAELYRRIVADQTNTYGFCASYWIGDQAIGEGCAISFWEQRADLSNGAGASRRRRRQVERSLQCRISEIRQYQALGVSGADTVEIRPSAEDDLSLRPLAGTAGPPL